MISRLLSVGVVLLGLLASGSVVHAQESAEPDSGAAPGRASLGLVLGVNDFIADADYSDGAQPRIATTAQFRYVLTRWLRWQVAFGHTWTAYSNDHRAPFADPNFPTDSLKNEYLVQVVPITAQLQLTREGTWWTSHLGFGAGLYRVWIENRRKVLKDPVSLDLHRGLYPGICGQIGIERFLHSLPSTSIEIGAAAHWVFAQDDKRFPSGYNSFLALFDVRTGVNYYFDLPSTKPKVKLPPTPGGQ